MVKRNNQIDIMRGIGILLVIIGHAVQFTRIDFDHDLLFRMIYSFHMPLFFLLSGYCTIVKSEAFGFKALLSKVKKSFFRLLYPFFIWTFIVFALYFFTQSESLDYLVDTLCGPNKTFWFLWVLFFCQIANYFSCFLLRLLKKNNMLIFSMIYLLIAVVFDLLKICAFQYCLYYCLGIILNSFINSGRLKLFVEKGSFRKVVLFVFPILFIVLAVFWYREVPLPIFKSLISNSMILRVFDYGYRIITALLGCFFVYSMSLLIEKIRYVSKLFIYCGKNSLIIYLASTTAFLVYECFYDRNDSVIHGVVICIVATLVSVLLSISVKHCNPLSIVLTGSGEKKK